MATRISIEKGNLALPHLVYYAKRKETITYKELARRINTFYRSLSYPLGYIRDDVCRKRGLPMLSVIVVGSVKLSSAN